MTLLWGVWNWRKRVKIKKSAAILRDRAAVILGLTNRAILPKHEWAAMLPQPNLISEVLLAVGAVRITGKEDRWEILLSPPSDVRAKRW